MDNKMPMVVSVWNRTAAMTAAIHGDQLGTLGL
jgi:hypothetical protein